MSRRRVAVAAGVVGLTVLGGLSLPGSSAYLQGQSRTPGSVFGMGQPPQEESLAEMARRELCDAAAAAEPCPVPEDFVPPWLLERDDAGAEEAAEPAPSPVAAVVPRAPATASPSPSASPEPDDGCRGPGCVDEAVLVVGEFADELRDLEQEEPGRVPERAVRTIGEFADELRELPEPPQDDLPLPEDTREALGDLVEAGVLEPFAPECVTNVGQLAELVADRDGTMDREPSPSPRACASPSPSPSPSRQPQPEPSPSGRPSPSPSPTPTDYPYDGPGHRVRPAG